MSTENNPYGQPGGKYGTTPYDPANYGAPLAEPAKYALLKKLTWFSAALYVVSTFVGLPLATDASILKGMMDSFGVPISQEELEMSTTGSLGGTIGGMVFTLGLYALVIVGLIKRQNWARVLGSVFAVISVIGGMLSVLIGVFMVTYGGLGGLGVSLTIIWALSLGVSIYWLVLAYRRDVAAYVARPRPAAF